MGKYSCSVNNKQSINDVNTFEPVYVYISMKFVGPIFTAEVFSVKETLMRVKW